MLAQEEFELQKLIKDLRHGRSINEAARAAGVSANMWSRYERGLTRPGVDALFRMARGAGVRLSLGVKPAWSKADQGDLSFLD